MDNSYWELMEQYPEYFQGTESETPIRILTDAEEIQFLEKELNTKIGIVYEDEYVLLLRDGVVFPDGNRGTYIRLLAQNSGSPAVVLPLINGKLLLFSHYRHSVRRSMWEIPRGFGEKGLSAKENAAKELEEETGLTGADLDFLGKVCPDSGMQSSRISVYLAKFQGDYEMYCHDAKEAISSFRLVDREELRELVKKGELEDGFTLSALALAVISGKCDL